jgi:chromosome segregation ATPase
MSKDDSGDGPTAMDIDVPMSETGATPGGPSSGGSIAAATIATAKGSTSATTLASGQDLPVEEKLALAERANEIYRQQLQYMQSHLQSMRSLIQDKESIIENLMLRFDLQTLPSDKKKDEKKGDPKELRKKADALAQRTILENFELRELVTELRDENFHLRNEIYEYQDKINRQALHISKVTKQRDEQKKKVEEAGELVELLRANGGVDPRETDDAKRVRAERAGREAERRQPSVALPTGFFEAEEEEEDPRAETAEAVAKRHEREARAHRRDESKPIPDLGFDDDDSEEDYMDEAARAKRSAREKAAHSRKESVKPPDLFNDGGDSEDEGEIPSEYATEEARAKHAARVKAAHQRKISAKPPDIFGSGGLDDDDEESIPDEYATEEAREKHRQRADHSRKDSVKPPDIFGDGADDTGAERGTKRRGSQVLDDPKYSEDAVAKRQERDSKGKRRQSSVALPQGFFDAESDDESIPDEYATEDAREKHTQRKHQKRKSSVALPQGFFPDDSDSDSDPESRKKKRAHARKRSLMKAAGDKGYFSGGDEEKTAAVDTAMRREKKKLAKKKEAKKRRRSSIAAAQKLLESQGTDFALSHAAALGQTLTKSRDSDEEEEEEEDPEAAKASSHWRDASNPIPDLGFDDAETSLALERGRNQQLISDLWDEQKKRQKMSKEITALKEELEKLRVGGGAASSIPTSASTSSVADGDIRTRLSKSEDSISELRDTVHKLEQSLERASKSKTHLVEFTGVQITRLTRVINALLGIESCKEITRLLLEESLREK